MNSSVITDSSSTNFARGEALRTTTRELVGSVFYGTLLKTLRNSALKGPIGHGGRGEEAFGAYLDGILAQRMGRATQGGVADLLYAHLSPQQERMAALNAHTEPGA